MSEEIATGLKVVQKSVSVIEQSLAEDEINQRVEILQNLITVQEGKIGYIDLKATFILGSSSIVTGAATYFQFYQQADRNLNFGAIAQVLASIIIPLVSIVLYGYVLIYTVRSFAVDRNPNRDEIKSYSNIYEELKSPPAKNFSERVFTHLLSILDNNDRVITQKTRWFNRAFAFFVISLILTVVLNIIPPIADGLGVLLHGILSLNHF